MFEKRSQVFGLLDENRECDFVIPLKFIRLIDSVQGFESWISYIYMDSTRRFAWIGLFSAIHWFDPLDQLGESKTEIRNNLLKRIFVSVH